MNALLLLAFAVSPAQAWEVKTSSDGDPLHWVELPVPYAINPINPQGLDEKEVVVAVRRAFQAWEAVDDGAVQFQYMGMTDVSQFGYEDGANVVYFEDSWPADWDPELLAMSLTWNIDGGEIIAQDIAINTKHTWRIGLGDGYDLQNAITHEVGHAIGLAHSEDTVATMFGSSGAGDLAKRDLATDDEDAVRFLYRGMLPDQGQVLSCSSAGRPGTIAPLASIFFAGMIAFRRRGRRADSMRA